MNWNKLFNLIATIGFGLYGLFFIVMFFYFNHLTSMSDTTPMLAIQFDSGEISELIPLKFLPFLFIKPFIFGALFHWCLSDYLKLRKGE